MFDSLDPMNWSVPGFLAFLEFAQTHVHWVADATQPFHLLLPLFPLPSQSFPVSGSLLMIQLFRRCGENIGASVFAFILQINIQGWFLYDWLLWCTCCPGDSQKSSPAPQFKTTNYSALSFLSGPTLTSVHDYWKNHSFDYMDFCWKMMSLLYNVLSRFVIAFLPRSKCLLLSPSTNLQKLSWFLRSSGQKCSSHVVTKTGTEYCLGVHLIIQPLSWLINLRTFIILEKFLHRDSISQTPMSFR